MRRAIHQLPLLTLILLLAAAGRIININAESLWVDEGFSYWAIRHPDILGLLTRDVHPPLYFVALRGWADVAGISELALRYFSVIPSILSVAGVYLVAREVERARDVDGSPAPILAALLMALADMENYVAQETRNYTWHVLWVVLGMWAYLRWVRLSQKDKTHQAMPTQHYGLILWMVFDVLLIYTHYVGLAAIGVQGLYALLFLRGRLRWQAMGGLVVVVATFTPWALAIVANQTENVGTGFNVPSTLESLWAWRINWFTQQWTLLMGLAVLGMGYVGTRHLAGKRAVAVKRANLGIAFLLVAWIVVPVMGAYGLNFYTPILMDYRLVQITPAIVLLIAFGLTAIPAPTRLFLVAVIVIYGVTIDDTPRPRPPWREIGQGSAQFASAGDLALAHVTPSGDWQVMYYYERFMPEGVVTRSLRQWQLEDFYGSAYDAGLPVLLEDYEHVWFMHWSPDFSAFAYLAEAGYTRTATLSWDWLGNALNVYHYDRVPPLEDAIGAYVNGMVLRDARLVDDGDTLQFDLWWSAAGGLDADYTVSTLLLDSEGRLVAQDDAQPFRNQRPTSTWAADEVVYDPHPVMGALPPGEYTAAVKVYQWTPDGLLDQATNENAEFIIIGTIER